MNHNKIGIFLISFLAFLFAKDIKILTPKNLENVTKLSYSSTESNLEKKEKLINFNIIYLANLIRANYYGIFIVIRDA